jgi:hypothetical protein
VGGLGQGEGKWSSPERRDTSEGAAVASVAVFLVGGGALVFFISDDGVLEHW